MVIRLFTHCEPRGLGSPENTSINPISSAQMAYLKNEFPKVFPQPNCEESTNLMMESNS